jgi:hypothetical protein
MSNADCDQIRKTLGRGDWTPAQERHLFGCPDCRAHARLAQAWKNLRRVDELEKPEPADEGFVFRVVAAVRDDRASRARLRTGLAAAAALLFFFLAGAAGEIAASAASGAEDAYAQLVGSSPLDSFLPD